MAKSSTRARRAATSERVLDPAAASDLADPTKPETHDRLKRVDLSIPRTINPWPVSAHFGWKYRDAIKRSMQVLTRYLRPDTGMSEKDALNEVLDVLDNRDVVKALRAEPMGTFTPQPGVQVHDAFNDRWITLTPEMAESMRREGTRYAFDGYIEWDDLHFDGWLPAKAEEQEAAVYLH
jgi:hypothetical protein